MSDKNLDKQISGASHETNKGCAFNEAVVNSRASQALYEKMVKESLVGASGASLPGLHFGADKQHTANEKSNLVNGRPAEEDVMLGGMMAHVSRNDPSKEKPMTKEQILKMVRHAVPLDIVVRPMGPAGSETIVSPRS